MDSYMDKTTHPSKLRTMLDLKLTVGQVMSGLVIVVSTTVGTVTWSEAHFETKSDANKREELIARRMTKIEDSFDRMSTVQTQIYGDVREIRAILTTQQQERSEHRSSK